MQQTILARITIFRGPTGAPALDIQNFGGMTVADTASVILLVQKFEHDLFDRFFANNLQSVLSDPNLEGPTGPKLELPETTGSPEEQEEVNKFLLEGGDNRN
jgi:hypothetical protein